MKPRPPMRKGVKLDYNNDTLNTFIAKLGSLDVRYMEDAVGETKIKNAQGARAGLGKTSSEARVFKQGGMDR